jgi:predicted nucleotidyltransferase
MFDINLKKLLPVVTQKIKPFIEEILSSYSDNIHSIHVVGSSVTEDFKEKTSDINSIFVLNEMDLKFIELIAPLGKKYRKKKVAAPLTMTPEYITRSLDVFPIEFLNFKLIHETVFGEDILKDIEIGKVDLRNQCEREIKSKLIGLRQGYISSQGDLHILTQGFLGSIVGYMPLFRGIIFLMGKEPPIRNYEVISELSDSININTDIFIRILDIKGGKLKYNKDQLNTVFEEYYTTTEKIGEIIDELQV